MVPFFVAFANHLRPDDLERIDGVRVLERDGEGWEIEVARNGRIGVLACAQIAAGLPGGGYDSTAPNNTWRLVAMQASGLYLEDDGGRPGRSLGHDWRVATWTYRKLNRFRRSAANTNAQGEHHIAGPWSPKTLYQQLPPPLQEQIFGDPPGMPWVIAGQDPARVYDIDYSPTDADCDNDVEADISLLLGGG